MKASALVSVLILLVLNSSPLWAAEKVMGMSKRVYDAINEVQLLFDEERWQEALTELEVVRERKLNNYERGHILNMMGYALYELDQMSLAFATNSEALALEDLPDSQRRQLLTTTSQLALVVEDYAAAEAYAQQLISSPGKTPPMPMSWVILAQAYIGQERWEQAIEPLKTAIRMQSEREAGNPKENWLSMLSAAYYNIEDYAAMREVLYQLVTLYPKERYLINLAALHGQLGETDRQLALVESLLDDQRLEKGHHLLSLANLFLAHGMPYKAAELLDREMLAERIETSQRNLELLSQAWYMAGEEERAIPPLEAAAAIAENGKLYLRVARLYMDTYQWPQAYKAARQADIKGGLRDPGDAILLQGMALARQEKFDEARAIFERAAKSDETNKWAAQWLKFIASEERRIAAFQG